MNTYPYPQQAHPQTPLQQSPPAQTGISPAMLQGLGQSSPTHPGGAMSPTQLMARQNAMSRMGGGMNMGGMGGMPAMGMGNMGGMNNMNMNMGMDPSTINPTMLRGSAGSPGAGMVNPAMLMNGGGNPAMSQQELQKAIAQRQALAMAGMNGMGGMAGMGGMNTMNGMGNMGNMGMNMGMGGMGMMNGAVNQQQMQQYLAAQQQQQQQQQQAQSHGSNSVASPNVASALGGNPYPPNYNNAAAMARSQTPVQGSVQNQMGMNQNFQTPQNQSQMPPPPPRPGTAMSQHTPVRPSTSMSQHSQYGAPSQPQNQVQIPGHQQFSQPPSISRPGTAAGYDPTSAGATSPSSSGPMHTHQQSQPQMPHTPHTPQQQFQQQQQQFQQQQQQQQHNQQMREMSHPPSRPPTAGSNHGAVSAPGPATGSPGAMRSMSSMGNVPTMNGMNGIPNMAANNMSAMGQKFGPGGMPIGMGGMSNMPGMANMSAGMAGMAGMGGMNGMSLMNNASNGMMPPPNMPRQGSFGPATQPTPQTPIQQSMQNPMAAHGSHQGSPTPAPGMSRTSSMSEMGSITPAAPGMGGSGGGLGDSINGADSTGAMGMGALGSGMNLGLGMGGLGMSQIEHMQAMQQRKAIALAAYQAQRMQAGVGAGTAGGAVDGLMSNQGGAPSTPGGMNMGMNMGMGGVGPTNAAQMPMQAHLQGTPTRPAPGIVSSGRVSVPPPTSAMSQGMGMGMMGAGAGAVPLPGTPVRAGSVAGPNIGTPVQVPGVAPAATTSSASAGSVPTNSTPANAVPASGGSAAPNGAAASAAAAAAAAGLPPLNVQLNQATTRVELVPLSEAKERIPDLSTDEISAMKTWIDADRAYEGRYRSMVTRTKAELALGPVGTRVRWWERDAATEAAVARVRRREKFALEYPHPPAARDASGRKRGKRREGLKIPGKLKAEAANRAEVLVPIRLEFDVEHHKYRDTFVWNLNDPIVTPETFAQSIIDDYGISSSYHSTITKSIQEQLSDYKAHTASLADEEGELLRGALDSGDASWWAVWRRRLRNPRGRVHTRALLQSTQEPAKKRRKFEDGKVDEEVPLDVEAFEVDEDKMHEEMRITIKLDITVGETKLDDQFEWDIENDDTTPEQFAEVYCSDLSIAGEFRTAIAHSIREQVSVYQKSLFLVGHPSDGSAVQDDDLRMSFLSSVGPVTRSADQAQSFQPLINYLSEGELDRLDKEREKDANKRRKRNTRGRRGVTLPDREPLKTQRTPAIGFPEIDPSTLAAVTAAAMPTSRRAAAAAASLTIANMVASENGTAVITQLNPTPATPAVPLSKVPKAKGSFRAPSLPQTVLKARAEVTQAMPSTVADTTAFEPPLEGDAPLPASSTTVVSHDSRAPRPISARRQRELEKEAKEREYADGQRPNMIEGVWHCSNCGCPDSVAIGRRKGPLGDKSQCGACGKFWHRHRRPRPVEYNTAADYHSNLRHEAERAKASAKKRGGAAAMRALNLQQEQPSAPASAVEEHFSPMIPKHEVWVEIKSPRKSRQRSEVTVDAGERAASPASSVSSSSSERPLAQTVKQQANGAATAAASASAPPSASATPAQPQTDLPEISTSETPREAPQSEPTSASVAVTPAPEVTPAPGQGSPPPPPQRPQWQEDALTELQGRYPSDRFDIVLRRGVGAGGAAEWRVRCLDCPGKVYKPGPEESLQNFEVHLRNRAHRARVSERTAAAGGSATPASGASS